MHTRHTVPIAAACGLLSMRLTVKFLPTLLRNRILLAVAVIALLASATAWSLRKPEPLALLTSPVIRGDLEQTVEATGIIDAYQLVSVGAQASGQIKSLKVQLGDVVKQGDLIAEIDSTTQQNSLLNAEAALENVRAQRAVQLANLREAELAFQRQEQMLKDEATSKAEFDTAQARLITAQAQTKAQEAQIRQRETELGTARANLGYTRITAPIDGTVVAVVAEEGRTVNANQSAPTIVKLAQLDKVTINAEISEADVIKIRPGMPVYFTILGQPERRYQAVLRTVNPAPASITNDNNSSGSSNNAVYYNALFDVDNPEGTLRIDMTAQVSVILAQARDALLIPSVALGEPVFERPAASNTGEESESSDKNAPQRPRMRPPGGGEGRPREMAGSDSTGASNNATGGSSRMARRMQRTPRSSLASFTSEHYMVRVLDQDGQPQSRKIKVGLNDGAQVEVVEGLSEGDQVVVGDRSGVVARREPWGGGQPGGAGNPLAPSLRPR